MVPTYCYRPFSKLNFFFWTESQEIPESVTAELEQLEQEAGPMAEAEAVSAILGDLADDDDELLAEMGPDFNILEYVDTDADAVSGDKTNLLDNLDLEDEDKKMRYCLWVVTHCLKQPSCKSCSELSAYEGASRHVFGM